MSLAIKDHLGKSFLFDLKLIDAPDNIEHNLYVKWQQIERIIGKASEDEKQSTLLQHISRSPEFYADVCKALIFGVLSAEGTQAFNTNFQLMHSITNDSWACTISTLRYFTFSRFSILKAVVKKNLFELVDKIISLNGRGVDGLLVGLLRQIVPGDHGRANTDLCLSLLGLLEKHKEWIYGQPGIIPFVFYSFIRLIAEEGLDQSVLTGASELCSDMLKNRYRDCSSIGRDFVRALLVVSHLECFKPFWSWFTNPVDPANPASVPMNQVLGQPSSKKYIACRLTPLMETELLYMMEHVKNGKQTFYEGWFQEEHFPKGPSDDPNALIAELIRYIVVVYHPSNAILGSNVVQRWSIITWLYRQIIHEKAAFEALLSLFLDWFFFDPTVDSIMNVEPGCLVLCKGIVKLPAISIGAISYLSFYRHQFGNFPADKIQKSIDLAMKVCIEKGVVPSLEGLTGSPTLDEVSKQVLKALFPSAFAIAMSTPTEAPVPVADPRIRSNSSSLKASVESSRVTSPKSLVSADLDTEDELEAEEQAITLEHYEILKQKIRILSRNSDVSDAVLLSLIKALKDLQVELSNRVNQDDSENFLQGLNARIRALLGLKSSSHTVAQLELPRTSAEYNKFKTTLLSSQETVEFPAGQLPSIAAASLSASPTEQIWIWKSIVLMIQTLPISRLQSVPEALRLSFPLIQDDHEILNTGLQDALTTLHNRIPVIPKIFDSLTGLSSEAFQTFVEQSIMLSSRD